MWRTEHLIEVPEDSKCFEDIGAPVDVEDISPEQGELWDWEIHDPAKWA